MGVSESVASDLKRRVRLCRRRLTPAKYLPGGMIVHALERLPVLSSLSSPVKGLVRLQGSTRLCSHR